MEISEAIEKVSGNAVEMPELHKSVVDRLGGDSQKIGLALGALRAVEEALRILRTIGVEMELVSAMKEQGMEVGVGMEASSPKVLWPDEVFLDENETNPDNFSDERHE